ncbi:MAG TPA: peptidylprolyl isomerase [Rhodopila sp.]|uniref:peptidylprolyl isomerase n=1 Tax=Rhodopila sp. TaxID=2480087 RepID=UPI002CC628F3|nr:peptidylprolyl isomerase [Rhodopila sp.]HVY14216.1 peptidylprolyl isomerase [Rhodopila sp.]
MAGALLGLCLLAPAANAAQAVRSPAAKSAAAPLADTSRIAAVVNGDVISEADIQNRARLFAVSTGLPLTQDVIDRLRPQILRQLINERLRVQEAQKRKIVVPDAQIAAAIKEIESRNNMSAGALRQKLAADGVSNRTLIDQIRAQLAWTQILRQAAADKIHITPADVKAQQQLEAQQVGKTEYRIGEIFIPVDNPDNTADAERFADTVIKQLRAGAPFPIVAAQFSQTQAALDGGEVGWVQPNQLDSGVAQVVTQMPVGAISNPIRVPGGLSIVNLQAKRQIGNEMATVVTVRQAFFPFTAPLTDPRNPTDQQRQALTKAHAAIAQVHGCADMEAYAKANNPPNRPSDPGEIRVDAVNPPAFRQLLSTIPLGKPTEPLVSRDGIAVLTVCTRDEKNIGEVSAQDIERSMLNERLEAISTQMMRDLHRNANIELRDRGV